MRYRILLFLLFLLISNPTQAQSQQLDIPPFLIDLGTELHTWTPDNGFETVHTTDGYLFDIVRSRDGRLAAFIDVPQVIEANYTGSVHGEVPGIIRLLDMMTGEVTELVGQPSLADVENGEAEFILRLGLTFSPDSNQLSWGERDSLMLYDIPSATVHTISTVFPSLGYSSVYYPAVAWHSEGMASIGYFENVVNNFLLAISIYDSTIGGYKQYVMPTDMLTLDKIIGWTTYQGQDALLFSLVLERLLIPDTGEIISIINSSGYRIVEFPSGYIMRDFGELYDPDGNLVTDASRVLNKNYATSTLGVVYAVYNNTEATALYHYYDGETTQIETDYPSDTSVAVVPISGQIVILDVELEVITLQSNSIVECTLPARLPYDSLARVINTSDENIIYDSTSLEATSLGTIPEGETVRVMRGRCMDDGYIWYDIIYNDIQGYMIEGDPITSTYWLEPQNQ